MLHNVYAQLSSDTKKNLASTLLKLQDCKGSEECTAAARTD